MEEREAVSYFRQIIYGVDYCHRFNICHRDLKPENLLLDKHRNIKIADFGMAALETSDKMLETSCGSPHYASPEIVAGKNYHGAPSDIWSCGIILFALLTGHLPFDDDNIRKLLLKVQEGKFHMPSNLSSHAKDLIWRMLKVDPLQRPTMAEILEHPLLRKYPAKRNNYKPPSPVSTQFVAHPVERASDIDPEILKNLQTLWHGATKESVIEKLLSDEPNSEKTFYCLLMKYRHDHLDESDPSPMRKSSTPSFTSAKSRHRDSMVKSPSNGTRHRRVTSSTSSRSRSRSKVRSRSRSRSHSRIIYPHQRSGSFSSRGSFSRHRSFSPGSLRRSRHFTPSANGSRASSPPPPLPTEAAKMVEAEMSSRVTDSQNCSAFASMLEQAFNFNSSHPHYTAKRIQRSEPSIDQTLSQFEDPPSPLPETADILYTSSPAAAHEYVLPRIFEEDRFADAVEEEMDLHMKRSLESNHFDDTRKQSRRSTMQTPSRPQPKSDRNSLPAFSKRSRFDPEVSTSFEFPKLLSFHRDDANVSDSFGVNSNETSRLRISDILKTDSFQTKSDRPRFGDIQGSPAFAYNAKFTMTSTLQMPQNRPKPEPRNPNPTTFLKAPNKRHSAPILDKPRAHAEPRLSTPPQLNRQASTLEKVPESKPKEPAPSKGKSLLRKLSLVPKRSAPLAPISVNSAPTPANPPAAKPVGAPAQAKPRIVSGASNTETVNSTSSYQSRRYSNAISLGDSEDPAAPVVSKQNWFMKMLNGRSEAKGFYSPLSAPVLRKMIILILSEWQQYGVSNISDDAATSTIRAKISSRNVLSLRSSKFRIELESHSVRSGYGYSRKSYPASRAESNHATSIIIVRERGSSATFLRFLGEMERILEERSALIRPNEEAGFERDHPPLGIYV